MSIPSGDNDFDLIAEAAGSHLVNVTLRKRVGEHYPMHASSTGKIILAEHPREKLLTVVPEELERFTPKTITSRAALMVELADVRDRATRSSTTNSKKNSSPYRGRFVTALGAWSRFSPPTDLDTGSAATESLKPCITCNTASNEFVSFCGASNDPRHRSETMARRHATSRRLISHFSSTRPEPFNTTPNTGRWRANNP